MNINDKVIRLYTDSFGKKICHLGIVCKKVKSTMEEGRNGMLIYFILDNTLDPVPLFFYNNFEFLEEKIFPYSCKPILVALFGEIENESFYI